jgi:hypothetical protein
MSNEEAVSAALPRTIRLRGVGGNGVPEATGVSAPCSRRGIGEYRLYTTGMPKNMQVAVTAPRRWVNAFVQAIYEDGFSIGCWTMDNRPTDLEVGEEVLITCIVGPSKTLAPIDPLDVIVDGISLRILLIQDERGRQERGAYWRHEAGCWTPAQRAAVSAHWSAQLRAKVAAGAAADKARSPSVMMPLDAEDLPW